MIDRSRAASLDHSLWFAAGVLGRPVADLQQIPHQYRGVPQFKPVLLAENLSLSEVARLGVEGLEYPEFEVEVQHLRLYRHREQTAHTLGYLGEPTLEEIEKSNSFFQPGDMVGKKGIEQTYDAELRGKDGERVVVVDNHGQLLEEYKRIPAVPGKNLTLSIDLDLQQEAARWLDGPEKVGAVVGHGFQKRRDPGPGLRAGVQPEPVLAPLAAGRLAGADRRPQPPAAEPAIQNTYSPGSTFKIVMATAGLTEKVFDDHTPVLCTARRSSTAARSAAGRRAGTARWRPTRRSSSPATSILHARPEDGDREDRPLRAPVRPRLSYGIDIGGEKRGNVPDPEWSEKVRKQPWYPGETISVSIGQGPVLVTRSRWPS